MTAASTSRNASRWPRNGSTPEPAAAAAHGALAARAPVFIVHSLAQAVAAARAAGEAGLSIVLVSAADAGIYAGPGWFRALVEATRTAVPEARFEARLDCGDDAGAALGAIRSGIESIVFTGRADVAARLAAIAEQQGGRLLTERPAPALDLEAEFFADPARLRHRCAEILASFAGFC